MILSIALRNLRYYWQRSLATILVMSAGFMSYVLLDSFLSGMNDAAINNYRHYESGSGFIQKKSYWQSRQFFPLAESIDKPQVLIDQLKTLDLKFTQQISLQASLIFHRANGFDFDGSGVFLIRGLSAEQDLFLLQETLDKGRWFKEAAAEIVIGRDLADDLGARLGSQFNMRVRDRYGQAVVQPLRIVGIIDNDAPSVNSNSGFVSLDLLDLLLDMQGAVTEIVFYTAERKEKELLETLAPLLTAELGFYSWKERGSGMLELLQTENISGALLLFLLFIIGFIGIWNTMNLSVYQRRGELAMCRALGFSKHQIRCLVIVESLLISFVGAVLALLMALPLNVLLVEYGIDFSNMADMSKIELSLSGVIFGRWNLYAWLLTPLCSMLIALLAALAPAYQALSVNLAELLTQEKN